MCHLSVATGLCLDHVSSTKHDVDCLIRLFGFFAPTRQQGSPGSCVKESKVESLFYRPNLSVGKRPALAGLRRLHELWDVDEQALRQSDPVEIALAVRALSESGPPHMY